MEKCKCGGEGVVEDGFGGGKFVCCIECDNQTAVFPDFAESAAIQDWNNGIYEN